ncbi:unnamed protein product [Pleuronectes platessa]|uniref:Uncharacterized protein n=1 Tax=Pleuronectes platessa TaxID=8262 RepID=A0A9N7V9F0_PLEPL|nr:unnamed protein product [Pleuronectes platessa]
MTTAEKFSPRITQCHEKWLSHTLLSDGWGCYTSWMSVDYLPKALSCLPGAWRAPGASALLCLGISLCHNKENLSTSSRVEAPQPRGEHPNTESPAPDGSDRPESGTVLNALVTAVLY